MAYTEQEQMGFYLQANFLRGLAQAVGAFNATDAPKIDMGWLVRDLKDAANECEQEANA